MTDVTDWHSPEWTQARIRTGQHLAVFLTFARGDPSLSAWELEFLISMADIHRRKHGQVELSEKQAKVILRIEDKLGGLAAVYGVHEDDTAPVLSDATAVAANSTIHLAR